MYELSLDKKLVSIPWTIFTHWGKIDMAFPIFIKNDILVA